MVGRRASRSARASLPWRDPSPKVRLCASSWAGGIFHRCQERRWRQRRPPATGGTLPGAGLISRYRVPPAGNPADQSGLSHCSIPATGGPMRRRACTASASP